MLVVVYALVLAVIPALVLAGFALTKRWRGLAATTAVLSGVMIFFVVVGAIQSQMEPGERASDVTTPGQRMALWALVGLGACNLAALLAIPGMFIGRGPRADDRHRAGDRSRS